MVKNAHILFVGIGVVLTTVCLQHLSSVHRHDVELLEPDYPALSSISCDPGPCPVSPSTTTITYNGPHSIPSSRYAIQAVRRSNEAFSTLQKVQDAYSHSKVELQDAKEELSADQSKYKEDFKGSRVALWKTIGDLEDKLANFKARVVAAKSAMMSRDNYLSARVASLENALARSKVALNRQLSDVKVRMAVISHMSGPPGHNAPDGLDGAAGLPGFPGPRGEAGPPGPQGPPGPRGWDGRDGMPGLIGPQGDMGLPGPKGPEGHAGRAGAQGPPGLPGPPGIGEPGVAGGPGPAGGPGIPGTVGPAGAQGMSQPGTPGQPGPSGVPGMPGVHGTSGAAGAPGTPGVGGAFYSYGRG